MSECLIQDLYLILHLSFYYKRLGHPILAYEHLSLSWTPLSYPVILSPPTSERSKRPRTSKSLVAPVPTCLQRAAGIKFKYVFTEITEVDDAKH